MFEMVEAVHNSLMVNEDQNKRSNSSVKGSKLDMLLSKIGPLMGVRYYRQLIIIGK